MSAQSQLNCFVKQVAEIVEFNDRAGSKQKMQRKQQKVSLETSSPIGPHAATVLTPYAFGQYLPSRWRINSSSSRLEHTPLAQQLQQLSIQQEVGQAIPTSLPMHRLTYHSRACVPASSMDMLSISWPTATATNTLGAEPRCTL